MIISHKRKFIYIKTQKTAGTSTEIVLEKYCGHNDIITHITMGDSKTHKPRNYGGFSTHMQMKDIKEKIDTDIFNNYYKFMNVRNPWDRVVSSFFHHLKDHDVSFDEFIKNKINISNPILLPLIDFCDFNLLDGFIRYEHLKEDIFKHMKKFHIFFDKKWETIKFPKAKSQFRTSDNHYTHYYNNKTREIVAEKYAKDIKYFNYKYYEN